MGSSERVVARNFLTLGAGEIIARALSFATSIYLARVLGADMYGVVGFAMAVLLYFTRVADGGLDLVGMREIAHDRREAERIVAPVFTFRLLASAALTLLLAGGALAWLPHPDGATLALFGLTLVTIGASTRWVHLGLERSGHASVARMVTDAVTLLLVLALVRGPGDVLMVPTATVIGAALGALLLAWWLGADRPRLIGRIDWTVLRPLLHRSWPLVGAALLGLVVYNSDLIALRLIRGTTLAGYYAAAYVPISLPINLGLTYRMSLLPTLARLGSEPGEQRALYHTALAHVFAAGLPVAIGGMLLAAPIMRVVFGSEYDAAIPVLRLLVWVVPLSLVRDIPIVALMARGRESRVLHLTAWAAALNIALNLALIPSFGMMGAAASTVATEAVRMIAALAAAREEGLALAAPSRFWRATVAGLTMAALLLWLGPVAWWAAIVLGALAYAAALTAVGGIRFRAGAWPVLDV
ncbi:MAG TPA: flippase [Gemmatimonadaceae bacterium]|nr:flippase [Gemmatimonadaceae bacterium]